VLISAESDATMVSTAHFASSLEAGGGLVTSLNRYPLKFIRQGVGKSGSLVCVRGPGRGQGRERGKIKKVK